MGWFSKRKEKNQENADTQGGFDGDAAAQAAQQIQKAYWTPDPNFADHVASIDPDALSWDEALSTLHRAAMSLAINDEGLSNDEDLPDSPVNQFATKLAKRLSSPGSPYVPRPGFIWQGEPGQSQQRDPDHVGILSNASVTHFGCIEMIVMDDHDQPRGIEFVPLDDISCIIMATPSLFRLSRVFFEGERPDQIAMLPLLYGTSWFSKEKYDTDGTMTRFICHLDLPDTPFPSISGIGVGHQDFFVAKEEKMGSLIGLGSVGDVMIPLSTDDPRFDEKCRGRGIDPDEARSSVQE